MGDGEAGDEELVALLALLGDCAAGDEPPAMTPWFSIASEVARRGSAISVWDGRIRSPSTAWASPTARRSGRTPY